MLGQLSGLNKSLSCFCYSVHSVVFYSLVIRCFAKAEREHNDDLDTGKGNVLDFFILQH